MQRPLLLCLALLLSLGAYAQISNDSLEYRIRPDSAKTGDLRLSFYNFNFLRNYEYFNRIQDGYTLFGTQLEPQLVYYAHPKLAISAGVHLRKDFGGRGIYNTLPLFSVKYQNGHTTLINGVLEGNIHHRTIEPLFDFEKRITEPVEYGTQFIVQKPNLFLDAYLNWKHMIYKPSPDQERILGGLSADLTLYNGGRLKLSLPVQLTAFHQGGQIDTTDQPLQTLVNTALGLKFRLNTPGFIQALRLENYFTVYSDWSRTKVHPFSAGKGWFLNAAADSRLGSLEMTYWNARNFVAPNGMPLFQSVSQHIRYPGYIENDRKLLMLRYAFQKQLIPNLYIDVRLEPFIDLSAPGSKKVQFSNSSFLVYRKEFRLAKIRQ